MFEEVEVAGILLGVPRRTGAQAGIERVGLSHNVRSGEAEAALPWASSFCGTSRVCRISLFNALALAYWDFGTEVEDIQQKAALLVMGGAISIPVVVKAQITYPHLTLLDILQEVKEVEKKQRENGR